MKNCVVWGNTAGTSGNEIFNNAATCNISNCDIAGSGGSTSWDTNLGTDGGNNIDSDPTFVDASTGNLRVYAGSPAIDAGDNTANSESYDLAGNARIQNTTIDMGPYEGGTPLPIVYVDASKADDSGDGSSWATAKKYLQSGLALTTSGDQVWVADGVYYPDEGDGVTNNDLAATYNLIGGVKIYGGFAGTETLLTERDWATNLTILSGDIDGNDTNTSGIVESYTDIAGSNSYNVLKADGSTTSITGACEINGFYVTAGSSSATGGGLYCYVSGSGKTASPAIANCSFMGNKATGFGGAMYNYSVSLGTCNPSISNCSFSGNSGGNSGAVFNHGSGGTCSPSFINCNFTGNTTSVWGGAMTNRGDLSASGICNPSLTNCSMSGNQGQSGGAIFNYARDNGTCSPSFTNVSMSANHSIAYGGGMYTLITWPGTSVPVVTNTIIWGNTAASGYPNILNSVGTPTFSYCDIEGSGGSGSWVVAFGTDGGNNIDLDPTFVDAANDDLRLYTGSPAIDVGNNSANSETQDLAGNARIQNTTIDMGAYEGGVVVPPKTVYVDASKTDDTGDGLSWATAKKYLQSGYALAVSGDAVWVANGVYYPDQGDGVTLNDQDAKFYLKDGVKLYGGFEGTETLLTQRDWAINLTILSGDIDGNDTNTGGIVESYSDIAGNNSYYVMKADGPAASITSSCEVNGFYVTAASTPGNGGGLYCYASGFGNEVSPTITNCSFVGNKATGYGGALYNFSNSLATCNPAISSCSFSGNYGGNSGAVFNLGGTGTCSPSFLNCIFTDNTTPVWGGAITNRADGNANGICNPSYTNCSMSGNQGQSGGAIFNYARDNGTCSPSYINCSMSANYSIAYGGGMYTLVTAPGTSNPVVTNTIIWGNTAASGNPNIISSIGSPTFSYCDIEGSGGSGSWVAAFGADGGNNIDVDPTFLDAANDDLRLYTGSPAIDAGNNAANNETLDLAGNARIQNGTIDMGAYEGGASIPSITVYVDANKTDDTGDGLSWATAKKYLQSGLALASSGDVIWVADGVYYPDEGGSVTNNDRSASFVLIEGVKIYGGFAGIETLLTQRDWPTNLTILSGDIEQDDTNTDGNYIAETGSDIQGSNTYNLLKADASGGNITSACELNGFYITGGSGDEGAGLYCYATSSGQVASPSILNCAFSGNKNGGSGGAVYNYGGSAGTSSPSFSDCSFTGNESGKGAAIYNMGFNLGICNPSFLNCSFTENTAVYYGGAMYSEAVLYYGRCNPSLINCSISGNVAGSGGGFYNHAYDDGICSSSFVNCSFSANTATSYGGAMYNYFASASSNTALTNCIFWGNTATTDGNEIYNNTATASISYCDIQGSNGSGGSWLATLGNDGGNNIDSDPTFYDAANNDLHLIIGSPAIDVGDNAANSEPYDLGGNARIQNTTIDMGAYEGGVPPPPKTVYVDASKTDDSGDGLSWVTAKKYLQSGLALASSGDVIWVAGGVYYPDEGTGVTNDVLDETFNLMEGVKIFGGFAGNETLLTERDWVTNLTIISGDIQQDDTNTDGNYIAETGSDIQGNNTYYLLKANALGGNISSTCEINGFYITGGSDGSGAGLYCSAISFGQEITPSITNCTFSGNKNGGVGGAVYNYAGSTGICSPAFTACSFTGNESGSGAAVNNLGYNAGTCNPSFLNCSFTENTAVSNGGAMYNKAQYSGTCSPSLTNCSISGNEAEAGGGFYNYATNDGTCNPTFTNCSMSANNSTNSGGAMYNFLIVGTCHPVLTNSILWGNTATTDGNEIYNNTATATISYSDIQGSNGSGASWLVALGNDGGNNIDSDPTFVDAANNDLRLYVGSPAIDVGNNAANTETYDLAGNARIQNTTIDLGAYEGGVPLPSKTVFVDVSKTDDSGDGLSWATAKKYLQSALALAVSTDAVWVAGGVYYPDEGAGVTNNDQSATFNLIDGVKIYGGFAGTETLLTERDWATNETILSGDIDGNDTNTDGNNIAEAYTYIVGSNSTNVLYVNGTVTSVTSSCEVNGFYITAGSAVNGGGIYYYSLGAGLEASAKVTNCSFSGNMAISSGGAIGCYPQSSGTVSPIITNCSFSGNNAENGGAIALTSFFDGNLNATITNCSFSGNSAVEKGGAVYTYNFGTSNHFMKNCVLWGNTATAGFEIFNFTINIDLKISYCDIAGCGGSGGAWDDTFGFDQGGNIASDPSFVDAANGDLRLYVGSPAIDVGNNTANSETLDLAGNARIQNTTIDMGAYEGGVAYPKTIFVDANTANNGDGLSWAKPSSISKTGWHWLYRRMKFGWQMVFIILTKVMVLLMMTRLPPST